MKRILALAGGRIAHWSGDDGFLAWWGRSLAAWVPVRWRRALGMDRGRLLLHAESGELLLRLERADGIREVDRIPLAAAAAGSVPVFRRQFADLPRWMLLPAGSGLRRRLVLPASARDRLREIAGFEVDRQTPFDLPSVVYDARIVGRRGEGNMEVELVVMPKAKLDAHLRALGHAAGSLAGVDLAAGDGEPLGLNLLPRDARRRQPAAMRRANLVLAAVAVLAVSATMAKLLDNRHEALAELQAVTEARVEQARVVSKQRRELADLVEGRSFIERQRRERPAMVEVLDHLARQLPDDTHLERLSADGGRVSLVGLSGGASALVGRLTGPGPVHSPALTGVLQPDPVSGRERFTLVAELAGGTNEPGP